MQRFPHPHQDEIEPLVAHPECVREDADLADDFAGGEVPDQPHLAREAEAAGHGASDLGRDAERHRRGVGDEDRFDHVAVGQAQGQFFGTVNGPFAADDLRGCQRETGRERGAETLRQVGHLVEGSDAVTIDPSEDLPGAKPLQAELLEFRFERRALELGEVPGPG